MINNVNPAIIRSSFPFRMLKNLPKYRAKQENTNERNPAATTNSILFNWSMPNETLIEKVSKLTASAMTAGCSCRFSMLLSSSCRSMWMPIIASRTPDSKLLHTEKSPADQSPITKPASGNTKFKNVIHSARTSLPFRNCINDSTTMTSIVVTLAAIISNNELTSLLPHPSILCARLGGHSYYIIC